MKIRNRLIIARIKSALACFKPNSATARSASHVAPFVCNSAVPRLIPIPNRMTVPQGIFGWASFHVMMPMPGMNIRATAVIVVVLVSNLCRMPSVAQKASSVSEIANSFFSEAFIGPSSRSDFRIASRPPDTSDTSGGIMRVITKKSAIDIKMPNGAAATSHSSQVIVVCSVFSIKPTATMFCAAAVLMPTFQMLAVCTVVIISMPAKAPFRLTPKAAMMPSVIGTRQDTRAVVDGTRKAMTKPTRIVPITTLVVLVPTRDRIISAILLSSPVAVMAAARNSAAATRTSAVLAKPLNASVSAALVPIKLPLGFAGLGKTEKESHERRDHDGGNCIIDGFRHPDDYCEGKNREHPVARDRQSRRRGEQDHRDHRDDAGQQAPIDIGSFLRNRRRIRTLNRLL